MAIEFNDEIEFLRECVRREFRGLDFDEEGLARYHKKVALIKAVLYRANYTVTDEQALETYNNCDDDDEASLSVTEFMEWLLGDALHMVSHYETALREDHNKLAVLKAVLMRGNYTDMVSLDDIAAQVKKEREEEAAKEQANQ